MKSGPDKIGEILQSRINLTRELIQTKGFSGLLNNTKWFEIFEHLEASQTIFDIKLLLEDKLRHSDVILELEDTFVLVDNTGDFIDFSEIEFLRMKTDNNLANFLDNLKVEYFGENDKIIIQGYR